jgi:TPR repeat protein
MVCHLASSDILRLLRVVVRLYKVSLWGLCFMVLAPSANAADLDIALNEQDRRSKAVPVCALSADALSPAASSASGPASSDAQYQKAMCLKFGLGLAQQTAAAVSLLREAALQDHREAQLALADTLQQGNGAEEREALHWYERAATAGDSRAMSRAARLSQRLKDKGVAVDAVPNSSFSNPEDLGNMPPGYHCHRYGMGRQYCHGGVFH